MEQSRDLKLVIQIPAYNEAEVLEDTLRALPASVPGTSSIEVIVIDDGSRDETAEIAERCGATVVRLLSHQGLSAAFRAGLEAALAAGADVIVNTDADNQYEAEDIAAIVQPVVDGRADVVIGDRVVGRSPWMGPLKRFLQRLGSQAVGVASGINLPDVTSGFRAFSRNAAIRINVFNPFTYTLETIIQAGSHNLEVRSVPVRTNAPTRPSRLYRGIGTYVRKSIVTIFRIYTVYKPLKTFFALGALLMLPGFILGARFLYFYLIGDRAGHVQSLILAAVLLITGFQTMLIGLLADLISVNRRLMEDTLVRLKRAELYPRSRPAGTKERQSQRIGGTEREEREVVPDSDSRWVWVLDEEGQIPPVETARPKKRRRAPSRHRVTDRDRRQGPKGSNDRKR